MRRRTRAARFLLGLATLAYMLLLVASWNHMKHHQMPQSFLLCDVLAPSPLESSDRRRRTTNHSDYAYAFAIGGCSPERPAHLGYIYDILVSTRILREEGSTQDVVVFVQMSSQTNATELSTEETRWLTDMGIDVRYIPKSETENFIEITLEKFRVLSLIEYRRVLFLDGDVMPIGNLDFFFRLSDSGVLKENVVIAGTLEPANAGFFMLAPKEGDYQRIQQIIHDHEIRYTDPDQPNATFDERLGWGHVHENGDVWKSRYREGSNWTFQAVMGDQGLLYYWVKYEKKSFTQIRRRWFDDYGLHENGTVVLESSRRGLLKEHSKPRAEMKGPCGKYRCDFAHFTGRGKPWFSGPPANLRTMSYNESLESPEKLFFYTLRQLNDDLSMGIDFDDWKSFGRPNLGLAGGGADFAQRIQRKRKELDISSQ